MPAVERNAPVSMDHAPDADATATGAGRYGKPGQIGRGGSFMWLDEAAPGAAWEAAQAAAAKLADVEQRQQAVASGGRFGTAGQIGRGGSFMWLDNAAPGAAWVAAQAAAAAFEDQQHGGAATHAHAPCPRGHPTRRGPALEDHWDCDGCGREIRQGQNHMRCAACDWDLCGQCADRGVGGGGGGDMEGRPPATKTTSKKNTKGKKSKGKKGGGKKKRGSLVSRSPRRTRYVYHIAGAYSTIPNPVRSPITRAGVGVGEGGKGKGLSGTGSAGKDGELKLTSGAAVGVGYVRWAGTMERSRSPSSGKARGGAAAAAARLPYIVRVGERGQKHERGVHVGKRKKKNNQTKKSPRGGRQQGSSKKSNGAEGALLSQSPASTSKLTCSPDRVEAIANEGEEGHGSSDDTQPQEDGHHGETEQETSTSHPSPSTAIMKQELAALREKLANARKLKQSKADSPASHAQRPPLKPTRPPGQQRRHPGRGKGHSPGRPGGRHTPLTAPGFVMMVAHSAIVYTGTTKIANRILKPRGLTTSEMSNTVHKRGLIRSPWRRNDWGSSRGRPQTCGPVALSPHHTPITGDAARAHTEEPHWDGVGWETATSGDMEEEEGGGGGSRVAGGGGHRHALQGGYTPLLHPRPHTSGAATSSATLHPSSKLRSGRSRRGNDDNAEDGDDGNDAKRATFSALDEIIKKQNKSVQKKTKKSKKKNKKKMKGKNGDVGSTSTDPAVWEGWAQLGDASVGVGRSDGGIHSVDSNRRKSNTQRRSSSTRRASWYEHGPRQSNTGGGGGGGGGSDGGAVGGDSGSPFLDASNERRKNQTVCVAVLSSSKGNSRRGSALRGEHTGGTGGNNDGTKCGRDDIRGNNNVVPSPPAKSPSSRRSSTRRPSRQVAGGGGGGGRRMSQAARHRSQERHFIFDFIHKHQERDWSTLAAVGGGKIGAPGEESEEESSEEESSDEGEGYGGGGGVREEVGEEY